MTTPNQQHPDGLTLERAWHFVITQLAFRNPLKVQGSNMALHTLDRIIAGRSR